MASRGVGTVQTDPDPRVPNVKLKLDGMYLDEGDFVLSHVMDMQGWSFFGCSFWFARVASWVVDFLHVLSLGMESPPFEDHPYTRHLFTHVVLLNVANSLR
eukprot:829629-Amphidinium_carterae.1